MAMNFTADQQRVIDTTGKNILVSASAGSGKTAVLVARIMKKVCEEGVDIDRLLIVTFTNAAAAEMRERIHNALMERLEEEPDNDHLQRQLVLLMNAQITTIHSFCLYLVRNHFEMVDIDPSFRLGDEGEMKLLKNDILDEMLEDYYREAREEFMEMIEAMTSQRKDDTIKEYVLSIYEFAMSYPWPKEWLRASREQYDCENFNDVQWMNFLMDDVKKTLLDVQKEVERAIGIANLPDGPYMYGEALESDLKLLIELQKAETYEEQQEKFQKLTFATLSRKKDDSVSELRREQVKSIRDQIKKNLKEIKEQYFYESQENITEQIVNAGRLTAMLTEFTENFIGRYGQAKREKMLVDFNDLEHFAIQILMDENKEYTNVAKELQEHFNEIMIDEYQDSNLVQEIILTAVSKQPLGGSNLFMVGDVKQGIYRFRLARPELFMEKHDLYCKEEIEDSVRIDLHKNFRSRGNVIKTVNFMFAQLMRKEFGNIAYDETEALFLGASYEEKEEMNYETELLFVDTAGEEDVKLAEDEEYTKVELEARMIAERIQKFVADEYVYDKKEKEFRKATYGDIVILLRTMRGYAENISEVLKEYDIPVMITSRTGYFAAIEVQTVLNMLAVIDNPKQDIPMAAVLSSPIGNLSALEMAEIKSSFKELSFEQAVCNYATEGSNEEIKDKLNEFFELLQKIRKMVPYTPIHTIIETVLELSGYLNYVTAMPGGSQRRGNLEMLIEKAVAYEKSSYSGLFDFLRYMEQLKKYDVDFGEAVSKETTDNSVKIMSIHKSKGLEFPIVFVSATSKSFNLQDTRAKVCLDLDYGIGVDSYDLEKRVKRPTLLKKVIAKKQKLETIAEELRVFYVALTRAEEKLVLTGVLEDMEKKLKEYESLAGMEENSISYRMLSTTGNYLEWILQAMYRHSSLKEMEEQYELAIYRGTDLYQNDVSMKMKVYGFGDIVEQVKFRHGEQQIKSREVMLSIRDKETFLREKEEIAQKFAEFYQHEKHENIRSKISVSELKESALKKDIEEEEMERIFETHSKEAYVPAFIRDVEDKKGGTDRGNAYHKVMELTAHRKITSEEELQQALEEIMESGKMLKEQVGLLDVSKLMKFFASPLSQRMQEAYVEGRLYREQPFLRGMDVSEVYKKPYQEKETILIQGIIDAFFEEDDGIVLVDYKTDRIKTGEELIQRYREQIVQYAQAIEALKHKKVKEKILYSFHLNEIVCV